MKELVENENLKTFLRSPAPGEIARGKVIGKEKSAIFLEISNFGTGVIRGREFSQAKEMLRKLKIGDEISAKVLDADNENGFVELSVSEAREEVAWSDLKEKKDKNEIFEARALKANKGGLITEVEGVQGFLPVSQLSSEHYPKVENGDQSEILKKLQKFIGREFKVKILALDSRQKSLILSEKAAAFEGKQEILKNYNVGDTIEGEITGITDFGAFIKFPVAPVAKEGEEEIPQETLEGLIHISELDWQLIADPEEVVKVGEKVQAKIIEITNGKISLSLKALKKDPWQDLKYKKGDIVEGTVVKFNIFGAFVKIEPKIQALCHVSEFKDEKEMKETLKIGSEYKFQISLIKPQDHKMILKLAKS